MGFLRRSPQSMQAGRCKRAAPLWALGRLLQAADKVAYLRRNLAADSPRRAGGNGRRGPSPKRAERDSFMVVGDALASRGAAAAFRLAFSSALGLVLLAPIGVAQAQDLSQKDLSQKDLPVILTPHRAIYDLSLGATRGNSQVAGVRGRILYDFDGSACQGYSLEFRQVSELDTGEGKVSTSDLRSTT